MDSIVNKLSEIETAAAAIVEHAESRKAELEREMQEKRDQFDARLEEDTQKKLQQIREDLEQKMSEVLAGQKTLNSSTMDALKADFEANHTAYANNILQHIIEV